jgi:hypothetical protein
VVQRPQEALRQPCAIFPAFEASWAEEEAPPEDGLVEGVYYERSHHAVLHNFLEYCSMNHESFTANQLRALSEWVNRAVSVDDDLENAVSTCFLFPGGRIAILGCPRAGDWLCYEIADWKAVGVTDVISLLQSRRIRHGVLELAAFFPSDRRWCGSRRSRNRPLRGRRLSVLLRIYR